MPAGLVALLLASGLTGCVFDRSGIPYNNNGTVCGNDLRESAEVCDGVDLAGQTCVSQGFDSGTLACLSSCAGFDTSQCSGTGPVCGNDQQEGTEACDGADLAGQTCVSQGFDSGTLTCLSSCTGFDTSQCAGTGPQCGDDVQEGVEVCDGPDLAGRTCMDEGFYAGTLSCLGDCTGYDISGCTGTCGDDITNGTEVCDGADLAGRTCVDEGFYAGTLACLANCTGYNPAGCSGACGDATINGGEVCDAGDLGGETCQTQGYYTGTLGCATDCAGFDITACAGTCGDGVLNGTEECDGAALGGSSCLTLGCRSGTLACNSDCTLNPAGCYVNHDEDGDTVDDNCDNCPTYSNAGQLDADGDGVGNVCEDPGDSSLLSQISDFESLVATTGIWTVISGTWTPVVDEVTGTATNAGNALHSTVLPNGDYSVETSFRYNAASAVGGQWTNVLFAWRNVSASLYAYACAFEPGPDVVSIWRTTGSGFGLLSDSTISTSVTGGQWHRLRAYRDGDTVRCVYEDETGATGQTQVSGGDVWADMSGQAGIRVYNQTAVFTSFVIYQ